MSTQQDKAAAERDRKARIRRAREHLAALPAEDQAAVTEAAQEKELAGRDAGSRRASVAYLEDALVAWSIGGTVMAARRRGITLTPEQRDEVVRAASEKYRGADVVIPDTTDDVRAALDVRPVVASRTVAGDDTAALGQAANDLAEDLVGQLRSRAVALRGGGLTVAEVARELNVNAKLARDLCGETERGGTKVAESRKQRVEREVRTHRGERQEKCPGCGEFKPAPVDGSGAYVKAADFRAGRGDCRACYNRRWLEGKQRREAARAGK